MSKWAVGALRVIIAIALLGSVLVQVGFPVLLWTDGEIEPIGIRVSIAVIWVLGVVCMQVVGVCVWRLVAMVQRGTVFSHAAFRYVDAIIAAIGGGAALIFGFAVVARFWNHARPEDEVAPGLVALISGLALVAAGVALVVYVLRSLLMQAVALQTELDEVI